MSRNIRRKLSYSCVGVALSIVLPLFSTLTSGHFTLTGWAASIGVSILVSTLIAFIFPIGEICDAVCDGFSLKKSDGKRLSVCSLICDLVFVPVGSFLVAGSAYVRKINHVTDGVMSFSTIYISAVIPCMVVGFVIILLLLPVFTRLFLNEYV